MNKIEKQVLIDRLWRISNFTYPEWLDDPHCETAREEWPFLDPKVAIKAIAEIAKLQGDYAPQKQEIDFGGKDIARAHELAYDMMKKNKDEPSK